MVVFLIGIPPEIATTTHHQSLALSPKVGCNVAEHEEINGLVVGKSEPETLPFFPKFSHIFPIRGDFLQMFPPVVPPPKPSLSCGAGRVF